METKSISVTLSNLREKGVIVKYNYSIYNNDTVWGRKEWLNEDGTPKEGFFIHPKLMNNNDIE